MLDWSLIKTWPQEKKNVQILYSLVHDKTHSILNFYDAKAVLVYNFEYTYTENYSQILNKLYPYYYESGRVTKIINIIHESAEES